MKTVYFVLVFYLLSTFLYSTIINVPADQPTIQEGIVAAADTDTVLVADGTYFENIDFVGKPITVASNFLIDANPIHIENTIINGSTPINPNYGSVVTFESNEYTTSVITGFTLTEGLGNYVSGVGTVGGGIFVDGSSPLIVSNIINNNSAEHIGGLHCINNSYPRIINNEITNNFGIIEIGGLAFVFGSDAYVEGNIIRANTDLGTLSIGAGGITLNSSSPTFINNAIIDNHADGSAGGIYMHINSSAIFINCIISGNTTNENGGGIRAYNSNITMINTIVEGNEAVEGAGIYFDQPGNVDISFNDFFNDGNDFGGDIPPGLGDITGFNIYGTSCDDFFNIYEDPLFSGIGDHPFSLLEDSPCIDSGIQDTTGLNLPPFDIIGNDRIVDGRGDGFAFIDMGAYEYYIFVADFEATPISGPAPLIVQFSDLSIGNPNSWEWDFDNDGTIDSNEQDPQWIYEEAGTYSVSLTIEDVINQSTETKVDYIEVTEVGAGEELIPNITSLSQNYPNPFNPSTMISFTLTAEDTKNAKIEIYNLKGQKMKTLDCSNSFAAASKKLTRSIAWNGKDDNGKSVSSGIYFYKLRTDNFEKTKKMILMK